MNIKLKLHSVQNKIINNTCDCSSFAGNRKICTHAERERERETQTNTLNLKYCLTIVRVNGFGKHVVCLCLYDCTGFSTRIQMPLQCYELWHTFTLSEVWWWWWWWWRRVCGCSVAVVFARKELWQNVDHIRMIAVDGWCVMVAVVMCVVSLLYTQVTYWIRYLWCRSFLIPILSLSLTTRLSLCVPFRIHSRHFINRFYIMQSVIYCV